MKNTCDYGLWCLLVVIRFICSILTFFLHLGGFWMLTSCCWTIFMCIGTKIINKILIETNEMKWKPKDDGIFYVLKCVTQPVNSFNSRIYNKSHYYCANLDLRVVTDLTRLLTVCNTPMGIWKNENSETEKCHMHNTAQKFIEMNFELAHRKNHIDEWPNTRDEGLLSLIFPWWFNQFNILWHWNAFRTIQIRNACIDIINNFIVGSICEIER